MGQSINIDKRLKWHKARLRSQKHPNKHLQSAWNLYGEDKFEFEILEECNNEILTYKEQDYKNKFSDLFGVYNILDCIEPLKGSKNPNYGQKCKFI